MSTEPTFPETTFPATTGRNVDSAEPPGAEDEFPFESSEFGVGGFLPHLDPAEGGEPES